jgi:hypothetical protein
MTIGPGGAHSTCLYCTVAVPTEGELERVTWKMEYGMTSWLLLHVGQESATKTTKGLIFPPFAGQVDPMHWISKQAPQPMRGCRVRLAARGF